MIRHISIFTLKDIKQKNSFIQLLKEIGEKCPLIIDSQVGEHLGNKPPVGTAGPHFGDVIQLIDFKDEKDAQAYPTSKEHMYLVENGPEMAAVTAIDYKI